jgi:hypothetical protein
MIKASLAQSAICVMLTRKHFHSQSQIHRGTALITQLSYRSVVLH